jgi:hypothetical protein
MPSSTRDFSGICARVAIAVAVLALSLAATAAPAFADPGNGNSGSPNGNASGLANGNGDENGNASSHVTQGTGGTFGDPSQPQPVLHPENQNGANANPGPYSSTRDGSPSLNGNGGGAAVGKPCAGCVGTADNKNPPGQFPDESDANAGYECDTNNGIGKTNPAHTGCQPTPPTPPTPPIPVTPPVPPEHVTPPVKPVAAPPAIAPAVPVAQVVSNIPVPGIPTVTRGALPVTGNELFVKLAIALLALSAGGAMVFVSRRRMTTA